MELLIELIVWMFKAFFGDPEKTVDTSKLNRKPPLKPQQRGPYNYGDESASNAPKTLEEILEEARRQAAERRGDLARPAQPPRQPVQRSVPDAPTEAPPPPVRTIVATPLEDDEPKAFQPVSQVQRPAPQPQRQPQQRQRPTRQAPTLVVQQPEIAPSIPAPSPEAPKPARASKKKAPQPQIYAVPDLLQAIRTAPPVDKRDAARQAVVMLEIFGPPRSRRGFHRPGARSF